MDITQIGIRLAKQNRKVPGLRIYMPAPPVKIRQLNPDGSVSEVLRVELPTQGKDKGWQEIAEDKRQELGL